MQETTTELKKNTELFPRGRDKIAQGHFCSGTIFHRTLLHRDTFAQGTLLHGGRFCTGDAFARWDTFARGHSSTGGHFLKVGHFCTAFI